MILCSKLFVYYKGRIKVPTADNYIYATPLEIASSIGSLELVKFLLLNGAKIGDNEYLVPNGNVGDLVVVSKHIALNQSFDFKNKKKIILNIFFAYN